MGLQFRIFSKKPLISSYFLSLISSGSQLFLLLIFLPGFPIFSLLFRIWKHSLSRGGLKFPWSESENVSHIQLIATPWTVACQAPLSVEFSRQLYWSGLPFPSPGVLPQPGIEPRSPAWQADFFFFFFNHLSHQEVTSVSQSVQSLSHVWLFATPWITACQASLFITNSWSLLKLMPIELMMPSSHLILCHPLLLLPPIPPSIRVFSSESTLHTRWPKYWSFSFRKLPYFSLNTASEGVWDLPTPGCLISMFPSTCEQTYYSSFLYLEHSTECSFSYTIYLLMWYFPQLL